MKEKDIVYLTRHDDWSDSNICCVNSKWDTKDCACCPSRQCEQLVIGCGVLGIEGCKEIDSNGYQVMVFE